MFEPSGAAVGPRRGHAGAVRLMGMLLRRIADRLLRPGAIPAPAHTLVAELAEAELVRIPLDRLRIENLVRISGENARHIDALAEVAGTLPPIVVHRPSMTVIDGAHRVRAAQSAGAQWIDAVYFDGDDAEVLLLAVRLNSGHGLPLSAADRRAAAEQAMSFFPEWSNRTLAEAVGLSERAIAGVRKRRSVNPRRIRLDQPPALQALRTDPALAATAAARQLLLAFESLPWDPAVWSAVSEDLSPHSAALIAELARRQADHWAALADSARRQADSIAETSAA
ncbi:ParB/RepB/Spo0J family partition protein [Nocardia concava]|uniref:ParB/RepB/Spo0J family partition protein n=1 Tax=Nocardia concava TaxID=257281 RepID=UPI0002EA8D0F|nr:ParB N-terminal domain-containing protein [Nocardia concava]